MPMAGVVCGIRGDFEQVLCTEAARGIRCVLLGIFYFARFYCHGKSALMFSFMPSIGHLASDTA